MRIIHLVAGLIAAMTVLVDVIAADAGTTDRREQTVYQTKGIVLQPRDIADWVGASYWEQKIGGVFRFAIDPRMQADAEERDAVLATAWQLKPEAIAAESRIVAFIPKRPGKPLSKDVAYQIVFRPRTTAQEKNTVETRFIAEGTAAKPIAASMPAVAVIPQLPRSYSYAGFPNNNLPSYWAKHPREMQTILSWIAGSANPSFDQILTTRSVAGVVVRETCFRVTGAKLTSGLITNLAIVLLGETAPATASLPSYYNARDFGDLQIESIQGQADVPERDKLGAITGLSELPVAERLPAKYAIWQYFMKGVRDAEIDAIVPLPGTDRRTLLTLRFGAGNTISVQRIGEDRKGSILEAPGELRRVNGFDASSTDAPALLAWLKKRYPAVVPKGGTVAELETSVTAEIQTKSATPAWFKDNYGIEILGRSEAQSQLARLFQYQPQQLVDLQDFTGAELQVLEVALEKMSDQLVSTFKGLQIARQKAAVDLIGVSATKFAINNPMEAGVAMVRDKNRLITIFDSSRLNAESLFIGGAGADGKPKVAGEALKTIAHELGHMAAAMPGMRAAFDGLVRSKEIKPVTWYAASNPKDEFFPEAFSLYVGDPEWLKNNRPDLFKWFEALGKG
uniref:Uncharacterized protein n=1 Tax=Rhodopseudomonas palustris (strain BisA53) TaxID=316055 RepID=Q07PB9_RHOP5